MTEMIDVEVRAVRDGRWWVLHLAEGGTTQSRTLTQIEAMVADYVCVTRDVPADSVNVILVEIDPGAGLADALAAARQAQADAVLAQEKAAAQIRALARTLRENGLSGAETALVLGVSKQRVSQLTAIPAATVAVTTSGSASAHRKALTPRSA